MRRGRTWRFRWPASGSDRGPLTWSGSDSGLATGTGTESGTQTWTELEKTTECDWPSSGPL